MRVKIKSKSIGLLLLISVFTFALGLQSKPANAAWPGQNGKIAYTKATFDGAGGSMSLYENSLSGGNETLLVDSENMKTSLALRYSADGQKVTYTRASIVMDGEQARGDIYVSDSSGANEINVTNIDQDEHLDRLGYHALYSSFNPQGTRLVYGEAWWDTEGTLFCQISTITVDGADRQTLTNDPEYCDTYPIFSPNGNKIAFIRSNKVGAESRHIGINTMNIDGSGIEELYVFDHDNRLDYPAELAVSPVMNLSFGGSTIDWAADGNSLIFADVLIEQGSGSEVTISPSIISVDLNGNTETKYNLEYSGDSEDPESAPSEIKYLLNPQYTPEGQIIFKSMLHNMLTSDLTAELSIIESDGTDLRPIETGSPHGGQSVALAIYAYTLPTVQPLAGGTSGGGVALVSPVNGKEILFSQSACSEIMTSSTVAESSLGSQDQAYNYPSGLVSFTLEGCQVGGDTTITLIFGGLSGEPSDYVARKYSPNAEGDKYFDIPGATITSATHGGQPAIRLVYTITDGGPLDLDGEANGVIVDPVGLGVLASAEGQLLAETGRSVIMLQLMSAAVILAGGSYLLRRVYA